MKRLLLPALVAALFLGLHFALQPGDPYPDLQFTTREYAPGLKLDVIAQRSRNPGPRPVLLFLHGGGWRTGHRGWRDPLVVRLVRDGWLGVSVDYRLSQQAVFPAQIRDCKLAVRWVRANAADLGADPRRIVACGVSAGGHLAALLGTSAGVPELEGDGERTEVSAVIDMYGPVDLLAERTQGPRDSDAPDSFETRFLGARPSTRPDLVRLSNPITWLSPDDPPTLILHGADDVQVPVEQSEQLAEALRAKGIPVTLVVVPDAGHGLVGQGDLIYAEAKRFLSER